MILLILDLASHRANSQMRIVLYRCSSADAWTEGCIVVNGTKADTCRCHTDKEAIRILAELFQLLDELTRSQSCKSKRNIPTGVRLETPLATGL